MADEKKGITVKIDANLHAEIREYLERHEGMTMAEFITLAGAFKHTFESLDESINGLSAWVAYVEDLSDMIYEEADDETEVPAMQM